MRFMMLMIPKGYETAAPGTVPDATAVAAMTQDTGPAAEGTAGGDAGSNNAGDGGAGSEGEGDA